MLGYLSADIICSEKQTVSYEEQIMSKDPKEANSFPRAKLEENCELRGTDNVQGQISAHIFAPNGDYCLYHPSNLFSQRAQF